MFTILPDADKALEFFSPFAPIAIGKRQCIDQRARFCKVTDRKFLPSMLSSECEQIARAKIIQEIVFRGNPNMTILPVEILPHLAELLK